MNIPLGGIAEFLAAILATLIGLLGGVYVVILRRLVQRIDEIFARLDSNDQRMNGHAERIVRLEERIR